MPISLGLGLPYGPTWLFKTPISDFIGEAYFFRISNIRLERESNILERESEGNSCIELGTSRIQGFKSFSFIK